jgi:hypothetical protein
MMYSVSIYFEGGPTQSVRPCGQALKTKKRMPHGI